MDHDPNQETEMKTQMAFCSACDREVEIVWTDPPLHGGQATIPDSPEVICLDYGNRCTGALCPMLGVDRLVMAVRLARSEFGAERLASFRAFCDLCGHTSDMTVLDPSTAHCSECGSVSRYAVLKIDDDDYIALAGVES